MLIFNRVLYFVVLLFKAHWEFLEESQEGPIRFSKNLLIYYFYSPLWTSGTW